MIDGIFDDKGIANTFANVFESVSVPNSVDRHKLLETAFITRFSQYVGDGYNVRVKDQDFLTKIQ